jgi:hypothetical protein
MEQTIQKLQVEQIRDKIKAKGGEETLNKHVLLYYSTDPHVAAKYRSAEILAKFAFAKAGAL